MINKLSVNPDVLKSSHRNTFVISYEFMYGDADSYARRSLPVDETIVIAAKNLYDHGKWIEDLGYTSDPLYHDLAELLIEEDMDELFPCDMNGNDGKFHDFNATWYDEDGQPHAVEFYWQ